jgi:DNA-binding NarL/FixJ family response regulator
VRRNLSPFSPSELEVLTLLGHRLCNAELAAELTLGEAAIKIYLARIFTRLLERAQALVLTYETGLVRPPRSEQFRFR